ncbi:MAG: endonuclease/exonuclease/phosphatase family protein [Thermoguttaceae bacterium]|nr:endonuclease/exonuclease/phosphatase family protein [Thermoguttaceae bacterium]
MKNRFFSVFLFLLILSAAAFARADELRVMSYNVWLAPTPESNDWPARRDNLVADIRATDPDLFGLQEAYKHQLDYIMAALEKYSYVGVGRDDGAEGGEYCPVLFKTEKFDLLDSGTFWLSETPDVPGKKGWDAACNRVVSWAKLRDKTNDRVLVYANTHFDHISELARGESSKLILKFKEEKAKGLPFIITGDFNSVETDAAYKTIVAGLRDARKAARAARGGVRTWPAEKPVKAGENVIDYIFLTDEFTVESFDIHSDPPQSDPLPSDHYSIDARLTW